MEWLAQLKIIFLLFLFSYEKMIELDPDKDWDWSKKGNLFKNFGNYDKAMELYKKIIFSK